MTSAPASGRPLIPISRPSLGEAEARAAFEAVRSGWVTQGPRVRAFERAFAAFVGAPHAIAVSSATSGLHLAMLAVGIGPGDEVICPSMSYIATANCIRYCGARPVLAEVDSRTYNLDPQDVARRVTARTKAILVVHQIGLPADLETFQRLAAEHGLVLVEDAACAVGAEYRGQRIGAADRSEMVVFSFHPRKVITTGDGGMVTTRNPAYDRELKLRRQHGMLVDDMVRHEASRAGAVIAANHVTLGYNYRLTDIQAAVGLEQLRRLPELLAERRRQAARYQCELAGIPALRLPWVPADRTPNWQSYSIYLEPAAPLSRDGLLAALLSRGIASRPGIMTAHRETAWQRYDPGLSLPVSEEASDRSLLLPLFNGLENDEQTAVIAAVRDLLSAGAAPLPER